MRAAAIIVQKFWRGYAQRQRYKRMRIGYMRLQALIRSRVLSHRFRHLRGHIVALQARARGHLVRRMYRKKMWAIVKIQAHVRRLIAQRRYKKIKYEYRLHIEALRLRKKEERELKDQGNKRAKEIAEQHFRVLHRLKIHFFPIFKIFSSYFSIVECFMKFRNECKNWKEKK